MQIAHFHTSANQMQVILVLGQLEVSNFALVRKIINMRKMPSVSTYQQSVILPSML